MQVGKVYHVSEVYVVDVSCHFHIHGSTPIIIVLRKVCFGKFAWFLHIHCHPVKFPSAGNYNIVVVGIGEQRVIHTVIFLVANVDSSILQRTADIFYSSHHVEIGNISSRGVIVEVPHYYSGRQRKRLDRCGSITQCIMEIAIIIKCHDRVTFAVNRQAVGDCHIHRCRLYRAYGDARDCGVACIPRALTETEVGVTVGLGHVVGVVEIFKPHAIVIGNGIDTLDARGHILVAASLLGLGNIGTETGGA